MNEVTKLPTRKEARVARSQAKHLDRIETAQPPEDAAWAAYERVRAIFARGDAEITGILSAELVESLTRNADKADARWAGRRRRGSAT